MRFDLRIAVPAALAAAAFLIPASSASAEVGVPGRCPDNFAPVPTTPATIDKDKDHNGWVCAKGPLGSNDHTNFVDDKGNLQPGVVYDPTTNTYWNTVLGLEWWATGNLTYEVSTVQDDSP